MAAPWRAAKSLLKLRDQINASAPNRNKASDGILGDTAHSKTKSEHNPDKDGVVRAMDITHDPGSGVDGTMLAESLVASRDKRILYIIWNRRIISSEVQPWKWRGYSGANGHTHHVHISVKADPRLYDDTTPWDINLAPFNRPLPTQPRAQTAKPAPAPVAPSAPLPRPAPPVSPARPIEEFEEPLAPKPMGFWAAIAAFFARLKGSGR